MDISEKKAATRKAAFAARKAAHDPARGQRGCDRLLDVLAPHRSKVISVYMPIRTEIDPLPAMAVLSQTATICVPVILGAGRPLEFHEWTPTTALVDGPFGAKVPANGTRVVPEVVVLPLLAFDRAGFRLGYGGGFYDRTLENLRADGPCLAIGFAFAAQEIDTVPTEPTDQRMDAIVTENETIWIS